MDKNPVEIVKRLAKIQANLRQELLEELDSHRKDLEFVFDPYSYSPLVEELREKYLTQLFMIQGIIQQLAHFSVGNKGSNTRVISVRAQGQPNLVKIVNNKLAALNGAKVLGVDFLPQKEQDEWVALITYVPNPFVQEPGEAAAWM